MTQFHIDTVLSLHLQICEWEGGDLEGGESGHTKFLDAGIMFHMQKFCIKC